MDGDQYEPEPVPGLPADVCTVGAGHYTSFAVSAKHGEVWSWGMSDRGQLGREIRGTTPAGHALPAAIPGLEGVCQVTGSGVASFAVTDGGRLFAWGSSRRGQLGLGAGVERVDRPRPVDLGAARVRQVSVGWGHAMAVDADGGLWTWGWPGGGQLGHTWPDPGADEIALAAAAVWAPRRVDALRDVHITRVAGGYDGGLALASDGRLYTLGASSREGTVRGPLVSADEMLLQGVPDGLRFVHIAAGMSHWLAVAESGQVFTWGWNAAGQLGYETGPSEDTVLQPRQVPDLPLYSGALVGAGRVHSVLVTRADLEKDDGCRDDRTVGDLCASWGGGAQGRLGTGQLDDAVPDPELVTLPEDAQIHDLAVGMDHTLLLTR